MSKEVQVLVEFINGEMGHEGDIDPDSDLMDAGILDSFSTVQTAVFIQEEFGVELEAEDLVRANLSTISNMVALIHKRMADGDS